MVAHLDSLDAAYLLASIDAAGAAYAQIIVSLEERIVPVNG